MKMSNAVKCRIFVQDAERTHAGRTGFAIGASSAVNGLSLGVFGWATGGKRQPGLRVKKSKEIKKLTPYRE